ESASDQDKRDFTDSVTTDGFQGQELLGPVAWDLPYADPVASEERYYLHCEAEGNFWQAMKDYAVVAGLAVAGGAAAGGAAGAGAGGAVGGFFRAHWLFDWSHCRRTSRRGRGRRGRWVSRSYHCLQFRPRKCR